MSTTITRPFAWSELSTDELRVELRAFTTANHPGPPPHGVDAQLRWRCAWAKLLFETGIAAPAWPREWYGMGLSLPQLVAYYEEMSAARAPGPPSPGATMVGPAILAHGSDEQRHRFLPRLLAGEDVWCQGFSEPDAGSDLPNLRTTAVLDGDDYVVNGSKLWTTMATQANWCFALVRTGSRDARQHGITYLLIDMYSEGVEVLPLKTMAGSVHFAQLTFTDLRVPVGNRVGPENGGWKVARTTLGHERSTSSIGKNTRYRSIVGDLVEIARANGRLSDPLIRQQLADLNIGARIVEWSGHRALQLALQSADIGPLSSVSRLFATQYEQRLHETAVDIIGAQALLAPDQVDRSVGRWINGFLMTRASTIGGGTSEIQRNTIAEQVLGLPRDPAVP